MLNHDSPSQQGAEAEALAQGGTCGWLAVCSRSHPSWCSLPKLIVLLLPATQGPWKGGGEVSKSWGARGTHGF